MSETLTDRNAHFDQTIKRFSKLNVAGRHYFIGRLIGRAEGKPLLSQELDRVIQRLETDSNLAKCWKAADAIAEEAPPSPDNAPSSPVEPHYRPIPPRHRLIKPRYQPIHSRHRQIPPRHRPISSVTSHGPARWAQRRYFPPPSSSGSGWPFVSVAKMVVTMPTRKMPHMVIAA